MAVSVHRIERLAPDQASLNAASKLRNRTHWPLRSRNAEASLIWGECQGSGSTPYRIAVTLDDLGYRCSCPSRKFPCKHALALMWQYAEDAGEFASGEPPAWVLDWLARRRPSARAAASAHAEARPAASVAATMEEPAAAADEADDSRAAERRDRQRASREASVRGGLDELDRWILDQLERGLASFPAAAGEQCRLAARRLVDAKAPGLASLVDALAAELFRVPERQRSSFIIERLGQLHLIAEAYRRQDLLPDALRQDVRRAVGWAQRREELLEDDAAPRGMGRWMVAGIRSEIQPDRLRRLETWLLQVEGTGPDFALLLDYVPASAGPASSPFLPGETLWAELAYFPSAAPLRAVIAERRPCAEAVWPFADRKLADAFAAYESVLQRIPWLRQWPIACGDGTVVAQGGAFALADAEGSIVLPIDEAQQEVLMPLAGLEEIAAAGVWDGHHLTLLGADSRLGRWHPDER